MICSLTSGKSRRAWSPPTTTARPYYLLPSMSIRRAFPLLRANIPSASMPIQRALFSSTPRVQAAMAPAPPLKPVYTPLGTKAKEEKPADGVIVSETNRL